MTRRNETKRRDPLRKLTRSKATGSSPPASKDSRCSRPRSIPTQSTKIYQHLFSISHHFFSSSPSLPSSDQLCKTHRHDRVENARLNPLLLLHLQFLLPPPPPLVTASRAPSLILVVVAFFVGRSRRCRRRGSVRGFVPAYAKSASWERGWRVSSLSFKLRREEKCKDERRREGRSIELELAFPPSPPL